jgi:hypothetical protein
MRIRETHTELYAESMLGRGHLGKLGKLIGYYQKVSEGNGVSGCGQIKLAQCRVQWRALVNME